MHYNLKSRDLHQYHYEECSKMISCGCGCGQLIHERNWQNKPRRFINGHQSIGRLPSGGRHISNYGYVMIWKPDHPQARKGYVFEHRIIMEQKLGRYLQRHEYVHHIDHNRQNNNISNIILVSSSEHSKLHHIPLPNSGIPCSRCGSLDNVKSSRADNAYRCKRCKTVFRHPYKEPNKAQILLWNNSSLTE